MTPLPPVISLRHEYVRVARPQPSFGGSQMWSEDKNMRGFGCGVIAAADLILYLHRARPELRIPVPAALDTSAPLPEAEYMAFTAWIRKKYLRIWPKVGINGLGLAWGLNRFFRKNRVPLRTRWCFSRKKMWERISHMLLQDFPVIFSAGPAVPRFWRKNDLPLHGVGSAPDSRARAHYMTAIELRPTDMTISSWGRQYRIDRREFENYQRTASCGTVTNVLRVYEKQR